jgi:SAM-dependent methyltransferase
MPGVAEATGTVCCPLCGISPSRPWSEEGDWRIVRCSGCGLLITWPRPDDATLARFYGEESYYESRTMGRGATAAWNQRARAILEAVRFSPRSVLDFGAGEGHLVRALREMGIAAEGIDTSPSGRAAARRMYDLELHAEGSADLCGRFQLVTLIHSLEHVAEPVGTLTELRAAVEPGGMVFIEVPHAGSVDMWWPRRRREILDLPVHLYHFVPATLVRVVERAGLRVVELRLSNPDILEWALKKRARWRDVERAGEGIALGTEGGWSPNNTATGSVRSLWASRVLPWVRRHFPGGKLQLLATRAS